MESEGCLDEVVSDVEVGLVQQKHIPAEPNSHSPLPDIRKRPALHLDKTKTQTCRPFYQTLGK
jgi:hypothetical protein